MKSSFVTSQDAKYMRLDRGSFVVALSVEQFAAELFVGPVASS